MKVIKPLTNKEIQEFKPELKQYKKGDGKGLYIMILPNSKNIFLLSLNNIIKSNV